MSGIVERAWMEKWMVAECNGETDQNGRGVGSSMSQYVD